MSEHEWKGWRITFLEKQDENGMWLDEVELITKTGSLLGGLAAVGSTKQNPIEKFKTREEALASGLKKAKAYIDARLLKYS